MFHVSMSYLCMNLSKYQIIHSCNHLELPDKIERIMVDESMTTKSNNNPLIEFTPQNISLYRDIILI